MIQACFINSDEKPVKVDHICWYSRSDGGDFIYLEEVVKETYRHPDAPEDAYIYQITTYLRKTINKYQAGIERLILDLQKSCSDIHQESKK